MEILELTKSINDKALFIQELTTGPSVDNICIMPVHNLWSIWYNTILFTSFADYVFLKNLYTNHTKIFYLYDLSWHLDSINYDFTLEAIQNSDYVIVRCEDHAKKVEEYTGFKPLVITNINLMDIINHGTKNNL